MIVIDDALMNALTHLVSRAGRAVVEVSRDHLQVREKADKTPLTAADHAAHDVLLDGLARLMPGVPVVSEEDAVPTLAGDGPFVLIDPIDGTTEFIAGRDEYTINLAVVVEARPALGLVYRPSRDVLHRGRPGRGAERARLCAGGAMGEPSPVAVRARPSGGLVAMVSRSHPDAATTAFLDGLPIAERIACGSAAKFVSLAEGRADVYPRLAATGEWDVAAGDAVLTAAGGAVLGLDGQRLRYGNAAGGFRVAGFVAWGDAGPVRGTARDQRTSVP